jgi:hypothetical protein
MKHKKKIASVVDAEKSQTIIMRLIFALIASVIVENKYDYPN